MLDSFPPGCQWWVLSSFLHQSHINLCSIKNKPSFKYCQHTRFCLECAAIELPDGRIVVERSYLFDYTAQRLVSIGEYNRRVREELNRVKSLKIEEAIKMGRTKPKNSQFHDQEDISSLPKVRLNTKTHQSMSQQGTETIGVLKSIVPDRLPSSVG